MAGAGALSKVFKNMRPVALKARSMVGDIARTLKGDRATGEQWYNQLKNKPGVRPAALEAAFGHLKDGRIQLTKDEFLKAVVNPKLSTQKAYKAQRYDDSFALHNMQELVDDLFWTDPTLHVPPMRRLMTNFLTENQSELMRARGIDELVEHTIAQGGNRRSPELAAAYEHGRYNVHEEPEYTNMVVDAIADLPSGNTGRKILTDVYKDYQRQPHSQGRTNQYFETVLRAPPKAGSHLTDLMTNDNSMHNTYHFSNPGQIAHARGSYDPAGGHVIIDEIQSDPYEALTKYYGSAEKNATPELRTPHGDMAKALLLQSARGNANMLSIPSGDLITQVRNPKLRDFYRSVYDDQLDKQFFTPLDTLGIKTIDNDMYRNIPLNDEVRKNLNEYGLPFAKGGLVRKGVEGVENLVRQMLYKAPSHIDEAAKEVTDARIITPGPLTMLREYPKQRGFSSFEMDAQGLPYFSLDPQQSMVHNGLRADLESGHTADDLRTYLAGIMGKDGNIDPKAGFSMVQNPKSAAAFTDLVTKPGDVYIPWLGNFTAPHRGGIGVQLLNEIRSQNPGRISLTPTYESYNFYDKMGMKFDPDANQMVLDRGKPFKRAEGGLVGCACHNKPKQFAQGGIVPSANGFMVGGMNLINPKSTSNGPLNVQWNTNNMLQSARARQ